VRRHADSDNLVLLAVLLEIERVVALMAVNNEEPISAYNPPLCILIKVIAALEDDEGWNSPPCCVDALDDCCPLPIALLYYL
ncbi:uncharacterized protein M421DRAFT_70733, partial [Didymella exigua CBS 183.55]